MCFSSPHVSEIDIWRSAQLYIKAHGDEASIFALVQADKRLADGDRDGYAVWMRNVHAIQALVDVGKSGVMH